jgi:hypothetical protein
MGSAATVAPPTARRSARPSGRRSHKAFLEIRRAHLNRQRRQESDFSAATANVKGKARWVRSSADFPTRRARPFIHVQYGFPERAARAYGARQRSFIPRTESRTGSHKHMRELDVAARRPHVLDLFNDDLATQGMATGSRLRRSSSYRSSTDS